MHRKQPNLWKWVKWIWHYFSQFAGVVGVINVLDDVVKWKGIINQLVLTYQHLLHPIFEYFRLLVHLDLPYWVMDYLLFGLIVTKSYWWATTTTRFSKWLFVKYIPKNGFWYKLKLVTILSFLTSPIWPLWLLGIVVNTTPQTERAAKTELDVASIRALTYIGFTLAVVLILLGVNAFL